jgi:hypothetical protein
MRKREREIGKSHRKVYKGVKGGQRKKKKKTGLIKKRQPKGMICWFRIG